MTRLRARLAALVLALLLSVLIPPTVRAALTQAELETVGVTEKTGDEIPGALVFTDTHGRTRSLAARIGDRPAVIVFADYQCKMICGTALAAFRRVLAEMPADDKDGFTALVVGLDDRDTPAIAQTARDEQFGKMPTGVETSFLVGERNAIDRLAAATGYRFAYDSERGEFAHPVVAIFTDAEHRIVRYLPVLAMSARDARLALQDAGAPPANLMQAITALCYRFDPATGLYTPLIDNVMQAAGIVTVLVMAGGLFWLSRRGRRQRHG